MNTIPSEGKTTLIVEDDEDIRSSLRELLECEGYAVLTAANGWEALEVLRQCPKPGLILADYMMPVMNGRELLERIRSDRALSSVPVIILSAIVHETDFPGAAGTLRKPVDVESVLRLVGRYCD